MAAEKDRIAFLIRRDGEAAARLWVGRTLKIYRDAASSPASHASDAFYRPLFERAIAEFEKWLTESPKH